MVDQVRAPFAAVEQQHQSGPSPTSQSGDPAFLPACVHQVSYYLAFTERRLGAGCWTLCTHRVAMLLPSYRYTLTMFETKDYPLDES
jgi:hypothetical protein